MGIQINGNTNNINAGIGSLSIEDINELDIVGVATAANFKTGVSNLHSVGLSLSGGQIDVGSNIKIGNAGVITATSFVGSGANLTGITIPGGGTGLDLDDNARIRLGTGNDLQIWHNGSESYISEAGTGGLTMYADHLKLENPSGEKMIYATSNGSVELYYDNAKTLQTTVNALHLFGNQYECNIDLKLDNGNRVGFLGFTNSGRVQINGAAGGNPYETYLEGNLNGSTKLFYDNSVKFETNSTGTTLFCTGNGNNEGPKIEASSSMPAILNFQSDAGAANNDKCRFYGHQGGGQLLLQDFSTGSFQNMANFKYGGAVELYHNGTKQCETSANGLAFPSGKGIDFSADPSGTLKSLPNSFNAEVLHDYEVGTFVPNIQYDSGTGHYFGSVGSGQNVASAKGEYIRIGDLVSFAGEVTLTGNRNYTQAVHISIGGMPYNGLHSTQQSSLMTGWGGAAWPKNDSNPSYRLIYAWHAYTTVSFQFKQTAGNNGIDGFRFWGFYRCAP